MVYIMVEEVYACYQQLTPFPTVSTTVVYLLTKGFCGRANRPVRIMTSAWVNIGQRQLGEGKSQCDQEIFTVYSGIANPWKFHRNYVSAQNKIFIIYIFLLICLILIYHPY